MTKLIFNDPNKKVYETGLDRGVLYMPNFPSMVYDFVEPWYGLINVTESPGGAEPTDLWASNEKYLTLISPETFSGTIEAYTYPDKFALADGTYEVLPGFNVDQQPRHPFALCYRSKVDSDGGLNSGYKIHIIYGATASPSEKARATINDSPEAITFSWEFSTTGVPVTGFQNTSKVVLESVKLTPEQLTAIEDVLYGTDIEEPRLPMPDEIRTILETAGGTPPRVVSQKDKRFPTARGEKHAS